jgi:hypothetical protein
MSMTPLAVAFQDSSYLNYVPYITPTDYLNDPTGMDPDDLVPAGSNLSQEQALLMKIRQASAWANEICDQVLQATVNDEAQWVKVDRYGYVNLRCKYWPILELDACSVGPDQNTLVAVTSGAVISIGKRVIQVGINSSAFAPGAPYGRWAFNRRLRAQWTYVNGYPHTTLAADVSAGANTITVGPPGTPTNPMGVYAGTPLTVYDGPLTETITVQSVTSPGVITLASPLLNAHIAAGGTGAFGTVLVSALPDSIREATIRLTSALIKGRGAEAIEMMSVGGGQPHTTITDEPGGMDDLAVACDLLERYGRTAVIL